MNHITLSISHHTIIIIILLIIYAMAFPPCYTFIFNTHEEYHNHLPSTSLNTFPSMPPQHFQGVAPTMMLKRSMSFSGIENKYDEVQGDDELSDDGIFQCGEKKRRLNLEQVKALEKSFELGNHKLEPERKVQLAKALGLQPRQIAIWFQNRRARWKTKQLENEYEVLKKQFDAVKADNDVLKIQNKKLQAELQAFNRHTKGSWSNANADTNLDLSTTPVLNSPVSSQIPTSLKSTSITQILHYSSSTDLQNDGFCNILHNSDVQHNFWSWPDQQHHHFH